MKILCLICPTQNNEEYHHIFGIHEKLSLLKIDRLKCPKSFISIEKKLKSFPQK